MYDEKNGAYKNFKEHFANGDDSKGYKDLIPLFRAEHFNATEWAQLFKASGAQYVVPVAEHHDGFSMYDSSLSDWTVVKMGPKRDTLAELAAAVRAEGLHFGLSSHRAEHNFFYSFGRTTRSDVNDPKYASLYGPAHQWFNAPGDAHGLDDDWTWVSEAWTRDWLARDTELVEKYKPEIVYFDWWIGQPNFRRAVTEFTAFYYNFAAAHGYTGVIDFKDYSLNWKSGTRDFERGQQDHIIADHWQTDTSISNAFVGIHRARHLQVAGIPRAPARRYRQQERKPAAQLRPALRRHHPRSSPHHAARDGRVAQGQWRSHLRHYPVEDLRRRTNPSE